MMGHVISHCYAICLPYFKSDAPLSYFKNYKEENIFKIISYVELSLYECCMSNVGLC